MKMILFGLLVAETLAFFPVFKHKQQPVAFPLYSQHGDENAPIPRRNYFPTKKRGYYEKWLANQRRQNNLLNKKREPVKKNEDEEPPKRKWVIWITPNSPTHELEVEPDIEDMLKPDLSDLDEEELAEWERLTRDGFDDEEPDLEDDDEEAYETFYQTSRPPSFTEIPPNPNRGFVGQRSYGTEKKGPKKSDNFEVITHSPVSFQDVGGYDNIKKELLQCTDMLANFTKYAQYNVRIPKGLILEGPPGNGKTLLAKAFAGECGQNVSFIAVSGAQFQEKYVGVGSSRIRELFELAKKNIPCIIYIDEIDALGKARSADGETSTSERDSTLNELLSQMDGFKQSEGVFVIGSTNRADILDTALTRPGRIDKRIFIGHPDTKTREAILRIHLQGKPCNPDIHLLDLVSASAGFSGAQLENWLNEAMLNALRDDRPVFQQGDLDEVINKVMVGWQPNPHEFQDDLLNRIAIHEMGHAVVGMRCCHHAKVVKVAIQLHSPTSPGITQFETDTNNIYTRDALFEHLMILLGGQVAENNVFSLSTTTGVSDDLNKVYDLAEKMILYYGMGSRVVYPKHSEKYKELIDEEIMALIQDAYKAADYLVKQNLEAVKKGGAMLAEKHVLKADEINELLLWYSIAG